MSRRQNVRLAIGLVVILFGLSACNILRRGAEDDEVELVEASIQIQIPCSDPMHIEDEMDVGEEKPHLSVSPRCGTLTQVDGSLGTTLRVQGGGFVPDKRTEIWWEDHTGNEFQHRHEGENAEFLTDENGDFQMEIVLPFRLFAPSNDDDIKVWRLKARQGETEPPPRPFHTDSVIEHGMISAGGWLLGSILGGGLGAGLALLFRRLFQARPGLRTLAVWLPWRSVLMMLMIPLWYPLPIVMLVGFGAESGLISVGLATFLLTLAVVVSVMDKRVVAAPEIVHFVAWARTLATGAVLFEFFAGIFGAGGLGLLTLTNFRILEYEEGLKYLTALFLIMLILDFLIGGIQYVVASRTKEPSTPSAMD